MAFSQRAHLIYPTEGLSDGMKDAVASAYADTLRLETFANERRMFDTAAAVSLDYGATDTHRQISSAMTPELAAELKAALAGMTGSWYLVDANSGALLDTNDTVKKPGATVTKQLDWTPGTAYAANEVVFFKGAPYQVIAPGHTSRADWTPDVAQALFKRYTAPGEVGEWRQPLAAFDSYPIGARVTYADDTWVNELAANVFAPGVTGWRNESGPVASAWDSKATYAKDALVTHAGRTWKSLIGGNANREPGVVGTWRDTAVPPLWVAPAGTVGAWQVGDVVTYQGKTWRNTSANNAFAPGTWGWDEVK